MDKELEEYFKDNRFNLNSKEIADLLREDEEIDLDEFLKGQNSPIGNYQSTREKLKLMIAEIKEMRAKVKDEKIKKAQPDDKNENNTLDEVEGKEELSNDKEIQIEKMEEGNSEQIKKKINKNADKKGKDSIDDEERESPEKGEKDKPELAKQAYLNRVKRLHNLKMIEYRDRIRKDDDVPVGPYFMTIMNMQRNLTKERDAFIKTYGADELIALENENATLEMRQEKKLLNRMDKELALQEELNERLDDILYRAEVLDDEMSKIKDFDDGAYDYYAKDMEYLQREKTDVMCEINKLNPEIMRENQDAIEKRHKIEEEVAPTIEADKSLNRKNKDMTRFLDNKEKEQEGMAEKANKQMEDSLNRRINQRKQRITEISKELEKYKSKSEYSDSDKKEIAKLVTETRTLLNDNEKDILEQENLSKNMKGREESYGDLKTTETKREDIAGEIRGDDGKIQNMSNKSIKEIVADTVNIEGQSHDSSKTKKFEQEIDDKIETSGNSKEDESTKESKELESEDKDKKLMKTAFVAGMAMGAMHDDKKITSTDDFVSQFRDEIQPLTPENAVEELATPTKELKEISDETIAPVRTRRPKP